MSKRFKAAVRALVMGILLSSLAVRAGSGGLVSQPLGRWAKHMVISSLAGQFFQGPGFVMDHPIEMSGRLLATLVLVPQFKGEVVRQRFDSNRLRVVAVAGIQFLLNNYRGVYGLISGLIQGEPSSVFREGLGPRRVLGFFVKNYGLIYIASMLLERSEVGPVLE